MLLIISAHTSHDKYIHIFICKATGGYACQRRVVEEQYTEARSARDWVLIVIIFIMGPERGGGRVGGARTQRRNDDVSNAIHRDMAEVFRYSALMALF